MGTFGAAGRRETPTVVMKKAADRAIRTLAPTPPIRLGGRDRAQGARPQLWLLVFMRCAAILWIAEGLLLWSNVLTKDSRAIIDTATALHVTALFFFCVLDFVAAVGLWLVTAWGGAVWIATVVGQILTVIFAPGLLAYPALMVAGDVALVATYGVLSWRVAREGADP